MIKLLFVCKKGRKKLDLEDYKLYISDRGDKNIPELEKESFIDIANS